MISKSQDYSQCIIAVTITILFDGHWGIVTWCHRRKKICAIYCQKKKKSRFHINYSHLLEIFISDWPLIHKYEHFIWACPVHNIYIIWFWSDEIHVDRCTLLWNYEETRTLYSSVVPKLHVNRATHKIGSIRTKHRVFLLKFRAIKQLPPG